MWVAVCVHESGYMQWIETEQSLLGAVAALLDERDQVLVRRGTAIDLHGSRRDNWLAGHDQEERKRILDLRLDTAVFCFSGVPASKVDLLKAAVTAIPGVLGSTTITAEETGLLIYFDYTLPMSYRLVGPSLRVLHHSALLMEDLDYPEGEAKRLRASKLFSAVDLEDTGLEGTVFDDLNDGHAFVRRVTLCRLAPDPWLAESVCVWLTSIDPWLKEVLFAAVERAATSETTEQAAQAALSVRRYLERLADALYPPRSEAQGGMDVSAGRWKNRLRMAVVDRAGEGADSAELERLRLWLREIMGQADKGVHSHSTFSPEDAKRVISDLLAVSDQIRAQQPPERSASIEPYAGTVLREIRAMFSEAAGDSAD